MTGPKIKHVRKQKFDIICAFIRKEVRLNGTLNFEAE